MTTASLRLPQTVAAFRLVDVREERSFKVGNGSHVPPGESFYACSRHPAERIAHVRRRPSAFEQEVLGKFITDSGAVFRDIEACRIPAEPVTAGGCTIGINSKTS